jgi:DAK2 domain fusion protein YloV
MVVEIKRHICDGNHLKWLVAAGLAWLEYNEAHVNRLNVFPVPDGDTGTNMRLTMQKAYQAIQDLTETHVGIVAEKVANGALLGARGNSGVILSQLLYGFAQTIRGHEFFDTQMFAYALSKAVDAAYKAVIEPKEGTILTVAREATEAGKAYAETNNDLGGMLEAVIREGKESLARTPDLLPVLKNAGVVDSGGQGLIYILEGMARLLNDEPVYIKADGSGGAAAEQAQDWQHALEPEDEEGYGYDVQFLIHGQALDVNQIRADIDAMGWSTLVVGNDALIKVHVHVHDPGEPISYAIKLGAFIDDVVVENMQQQYHTYVENRAAGETSADEEVAVEGVAVITVVSGEGLRYLFKSDLGAAIVISGGQTMNPSTEDFLEAIGKLNNTEIVLLPNNKNIILAAEQAAKLTTDKTVRVVPSKTVPQGINAMIAYGNTRDAGDVDEITDAMQGALTEVMTGEVTFSTRDVELNGVNAREGQPIALLEGKMVAAVDQVEDAVRALLDSAAANARELVTLYYGSTVRSNEAEALATKLSAVYTDQEIHTVYGGQPLYPYIISIE